jgi:hypothetical protein
LTKNLSKVCFPPLPQFILRQTYSKQFLSVQKLKYSVFGKKKGRIFGKDKLFGRQQIFGVGKEPNIRLFGILVRPFVGRSLLITTWTARGRAAAGTTGGITGGACTTGDTSALAALAAALTLAILSASALARSAAAFILTRTYVSVQYLDCLTIYLKSQFAFLALC